MQSGHLVGWQVAAALGLADEARVSRETGAARARLAKLRALRRFLDRLYPPFAQFRPPLPRDVIVCRCEDVSAGDLIDVAAQGCMGPNQGKAFTRCGMGPCMGRQCGNSVSELFAHCHRKTVDEIGHYRIRPPLKPISVGQLARMRTD